MPMLLSSSPLSYAAACACTRAPALGRASRRLRPLLLPRLCPHSCASPSVPLQRGTLPRGTAHALEVLSFLHPTPAALFYGGFSLSSLGFHRSRSLPLACSRFSLLALHCCDKFLACSTAVFSVVMGGHATLVRQENDHTQSSPPFQANSIFDSRFMVA